MQGSARCTCCTTCPAASDPPGVCGGRGAEDASRIYQLHGFRLLVSAIHARIERLVQNLAYRHCRYLIQIPSATAAANSILRPAETPSSQTQPEPLQVIL